MICIYCETNVDDVPDWISNHPNCVEQAVLDEANYLYNQSTAEKDID